MKSLYSKLGIAYQQAYSGPYRDVSMTTGRTRLVIAEKDHQLSGFGRPAVCLGEANDILRMFKNLYMEYPRLWYMNLTEEVDKISKFLMSEGHCPVIFYSQVIDLTRTIPELHAQMRKSYQHLANQYHPMVSVFPFDLDEFKKLHIAVVGFQTRPDSTWDVHKQMVEYREAFMVHSPSWDAAGLFIYDKDTCYYGVGKSLPTAVSHPILWKAICQAKKLGCREFEMGQQVFYGDSKEMGISMFKAGFGGFTRVRLEFQIEFDFQKCEFKKGTV